MRVAQGFVRAPCRVVIAAPLALLQDLRMRATCSGRLIELPSAAAVRRPWAGRRQAGEVPPPPASVSPAAAGSATAGARSSQGLKPERLMGFRAVDLGDQTAQIGVVEGVLAVAETARAQPLLIVRAPVGAGEGPRVSREEHLIPYVPEIVPSVDLDAGIVYIYPPAGLLDLGRQQKQLDTLRRELEPFTQPKPLSVLERMGLHTMPTSEQLLAAGRQDLVVAVRRAGGFLEVAQALGLRCQRKPAGYWDDEMNLDEELTLFVAAHWSKFKDPDSRQSYWYNQITHRINWEEPVLPQRIEIDDEGGYILTEAEEDRVMPSRSAISSAGRYDLHHAIMLHGGYTSASEMLDRRPAWPPSQHLDSLTTLRQELHGFLVETCLPRNRMPTSSQLLNAGRGDLYQAIVRRGGFSAAGKALGWETHRRRRQTWADADAVARELRQFILATQFPSAAAGNTQQGRPRRGNTTTSSRVQQRQASDAQLLPAGAKMPTHRHLASVGRYDLRYALQQHGSTKVAAMLGIQHNKRGAHNRGH